MLCLSWDMYTIMVYTGQELFLRKKLLAKCYDLGHMYKICIRVLAVSLRTDLNRYGEIR